jgi:hypothetical protein
MAIIILIYFILHIPAFILLFIGIDKLKTKRELGITLLIISTVYFIIGGGICGQLMGI